MNLTDIKTIVFDLGGVLLTLNHGRAVERFVSIGLADADEFLDPYHQNGVFLDLEEGKVSEEEFFAEVRKLTGRPEVTDEDIRWAWLGFIEERPLYKLAMLEDLRQRGYELYLLSNTNPCVMSWALSPDFSPGGKSLADYFDKLYLSYRMGCVKPGKEIFEQMIADSGLVPDATLFIDDGPANIKVGNELGFKTLQPLNGEDFRATLNDMLMC